LGGDERTSLGVSPKDLGDLEWGGGDRLSGRHDLEPRAVPGVGLHGGEVLVLLPAVGAVVGASVAGLGVRVPVPHVDAQMLLPLGPVAAELAADVGRASAESCVLHHTLAALVLLIAPGTGATSARVTGPVLTARLLEARRPRWRTAPLLDEIH
jgi:hypothetical protein